MECNFVVGQKVVCIDASLDSKPWDTGFEQGDLDGLKEGAIYTIKEIEFCQWVSLNFLVVEEIVRKEITVFHYRGFAAPRFRPLHETDISIFTAMLAPVTEKVGA